MGEEPPLFSLLTASCQTLSSARGGPGHGRIRGGGGGGQLLSERLEGT